MERASEAGILLLVCLCFWYAEAQQKCQTVKDKRCQCFPAEHEVIDIANYFPYPAMTTVSKAVFSFNPCNPFQCASAKSDVVLCMYNTTKRIVGLGRYRGGPDWSINSLDPLNFTITYYGGDKISSATLFSTVTFSYKEDIDMTFSFVRSINFSSSIQFEFQVIGPYVYITNSSSNGTSHSHPPVDAGMIAGSIVGSWFVLVVLTAVIVTLIISCVVKNDRKKRAGYQPIADQPPDNSVQ